MNLSTDIAEISSSKLLSLIAERLIDTNVLNGVIYQLSSDACSVCNGLSSSVAFVTVCKLLDELIVYLFRLRLS